MKKQTKGAFLDLLNRLTKQTETKSPQTILKNRTRESTTHFGLGPSTGQDQKKAKRLPREVFPCLAPLTRIFFL